MTASASNKLNGDIRVLRPGERVRPADLGEGVVIAAPVDGFVKVFFPSGERQVPVAGVMSSLSRSKPIVFNAVEARKVVFELFVSLRQGCAAGRTGNFSAGAGPAAGVSG